MRSEKSNSRSTTDHSPPSISSAASTTSTDASSPPDTKTPAASTGAEQNNSEKRQTFSRRGHIKSRLGCFSCKRRRVKCNELRPCCSSCQRLGLRCEYPSQAPGTSAASGPMVAATPQAPLNGLQLEDLRFYHQFLMVAHPKLPLQAGGKLWPQIAAMSHQYDYLAHALLGLGAAHVTQNNPGIDYTASALQHRLTAISRVNEEFARSERTPEEADALMAAVLCLASQSSLMQNPESMIEYLTVTRGGALVLWQLVPDINQSLFTDMGMDQHMNNLKKIAEKQEDADLKVVDQFEASVLRIRTLCASETELRYADAMVHCADALRSADASDAWHAFILLWLMPTTFTTQEFSDFIAPGNHPVRIMIVHCFLLDYLMGQFCLSPELTPACGGRKNVVVSWARNVAENLPKKLKEYADWVLSYCDILDAQDPRYLLSP